MTRTTAPALATSGDEFRPDAGARRGLDPATIKRLTKISPLRSTLSVLQTWIEVAILIALPVLIWEWWVIAPCMILLATRAQALFVLAHEAVHYRLYETRWLNDLVGRLCATPVGISMFSYRVIHRLHHNHLFGKQDPDTPIHGGYPRGRAYLAGKLLKDIAGLSAWKTYAYFWGAPSASRTDGVKTDPLGDTSRRCAVPRSTTAGSWRRFISRCPPQRWSSGSSGNICCSGRSRSGSCSSRCCGSGPFWSTAWCPKPAMPGPTPAPISVRRD